MAINLSDAFLSLFVLVSILALAPIFAHFTGMVADVADPLSATLLQLVIPALLIGLLLSLGRSAGV